jgi:hypothetical protein
MALPLVSGACTISHEGNVLTLTVGSRPCLATSEAKSNFNAVVARGVADSEAAAKPVSRRNRSEITRSPSAQKLYNFSDMRHQAEHLSNQSRPAASYYGQSR